MHESRLKKLFTNTKSFTLANLISKVTQYVIIVLVTHKLSVDQFGITDIVIQTSFLLVPIISCDIASSLFRFCLVSDNGNEKKIIFTNAIFIMSIGLALFIFLYPLLIRFPLLFDKLEYIYLLTIPQVLQKSIKEFTRGIGKINLYIVGGIVNSIIQLLGVIILSFILNLSLDGYLYSLALAHLAEFIFLAIFSNSYRYFKIDSLDFSFAKKLLAYSLPLAPNSIMWWIVSASNRYFIYYFLGPRETGLYAIASMIPALITIAINIFFQAWQISAIEEYDSADKSFFFSKIFNYLLMIVAVCICLTLISLKPLVKMLVAKEYSEAWIYAPFLVFSTLFNSVQSFLGTNYAASKQTFGALKSTIYMAIINVILNFTLIKKFGIQGAAFSNMVAYVFICGYRYIDTRKFVIIQIDIISIVKTLLLLIIVLIMSFYSTSYSIIISILAFFILLCIYRDGIREMYNIFAKIVLRHKKSS